VPIKVHTVWLAASYALTDTTLQQSENHGVLGCIDVRAAILLPGFHHIKQLLLFAGYRMEMLCAPSEEDGEVGQRRNTRPKIH
jgi:hypothetical protein